MPLQHGKKRREVIRTRKIGTTRKFCALRRQSGALKLMGIGMHRCENLLGYLCSMETGDGDFLGRANFTGRGTTQSGARWSPLLLACTSARTSVDAHAAWGQATGVRDVVDELVSDAPATVLECIASWRISLKSLASRCYVGYVSVQPISARQSVARNFGTTKRKARAHDGHLSRSFWCYLQWYTSAPHNKAGHLRIVVFACLH